jgi:hypothetical protein
MTVMRSRYIQQRVLVLGGDQQQRSSGARDGARRPCSHANNVRTDTLGNPANVGCDRPAFSRTLATDGTGVMRPCSSFDLGIVAQLGRDPDTV